MSVHLGLLEICCEAPSYPVVEACKGFGFLFPWDVRWLRLRHLPELRPPADGLFGVRRWLSWLGIRKPAKKCCPCGQVLPEAGVYWVKVLPGGVNPYWLCQCPRCRTIFWDEA
jgi:hypothetical protein